MQGGENKRSHWQKGQLATLGRIAKLSKKQAKAQVPRWSRTVRGSFSASEKGVFKLRLVRGVQMSECRTSSEACGTALGMLSAGTDVERDGVLMLPSGVRMIWNFGRN